MLDTFTIIQQKIACLQNLAPPVGISPLSPAISEEALSAMEEKWGFTLPEDYRTFVTTIGNGGADLLFTLSNNMFEPKTLCIRPKPNKDTERGL